jgi:hypothetical protein
MASGPTTVKFDIDYGRVERELAAVLAKAGDHARKLGGSAAAALNNRVLNSLGLGIPPVKRRTATAVPSADFKRRWRAEQSDLSYRAWLRQSFAAADAVCALIPEVGTPFHDKGPFVERARLRVVLTRKGMVKQQPWNMKGTVTGRLSSKTPNISSPPRSMHANGLAYDTASLARDRPVAGLHADYIHMDSHDDVVMACAVALQARKV